jgi:agmatinase
MPVQAPITVLPFIGSEVEVSYDKAQFVILPVPYEATTTYRKGCQNGPAALLEASDQLEYYDEELDREICFDVGIHTHAPIADTRSGSVSAEEMLEATQSTIARLVADGKFVIAVGGEHSITAGIVAGYRQAYPDEPFTVVQIDAHGDLRDEYEGSIHNHACVMHRILDMGLPTVQIGIRSICKEEALLIRQRRLPVFWARETATGRDWIDRAIEAISTDKVFITIDLDGIEPTLIPGVGTPQPGGINWYDLLQFLQRIFAGHCVIGCDIMELAPIVDSVVSEFTAATLAYKLIGYQAASAG